MQTKYLTRPEAAYYLTGRGLKISKNTLQKMATVGGGPLYQIFGNKALYTNENLDDWAEEKLSKPRRTTSEATANMARKNRKTHKPASSDAGYPNDGE